MAKWTDYTTDTNPTDTDEVMTLDADKSPKANKRVTLSTLADYFLDKLASKVFAKLETENQTVIGALNELNSKVIYCESENFSTVGETIKLPDAFSGCKVIIIALAKYARVSTPYVMFAKTGYSTGEIKFYVSEEYWTAIPNGNSGTVTYKGASSSSIGIPYILAFGIK